MKMTMSSASGVPAGLYQATEFAGVETTPPNEERGYPAGLKWMFRILDGPHKGSVASRITGAAPTPKNACGKMLAQVAGPIPDGQTVDLGDYIGRRYTVIVAAGEGGGTRVETVVPAAPTAPAPAQ